MITLHHLENSRSFRILWLLEELGLDYKLENYKRDPQTSAGDQAMQKIHPLGKAPIVTDDDVLMIESGAIIEYLLDTYGEGRLRPAAGTPERLRYNYWLHAAEGTFMNLLTLALFLNRMDTQPPFLIKPFIKLVTGTVRKAYLNPYFDKLYKFMEAELEESTWFAGNEFSAADVQMGFVMTALATRGGLGDQHPNCQRWLKQVEDRSAYQSAMEKNGEMALLGS